MRKGAVEIREQVRGQRRVALEAIDRRGKQFDAVSAFANMAALLGQAQALDLHGPAIEEAYEDFHDVRAAIVAKMRR